MPATAVVGSIVIVLNASVGQGGVRPVPETPVRTLPATSAVVAQNVPVGVCTCSVPRMKFVGNAAPDVLVAEKLIVRPPLPCAMPIAPLLPIVVVAETIETVGCAVMTPNVNSGPPLSAVTATGIALPRASVSLAAAAK